MKFASLGSGSRGNAGLIAGGRTHVLLDCGFSVAQLEHRLMRAGLSPGQLDAILVTHEHHDHIAGAAPFSRKHGIPVWLTRGTWAACRDADFYRVNPIEAHAPFELGGLGIKPFPVPHDAREPCQFVFEDGQRRLAVLTDTGRATRHIVESLQGCDALVLETNYDPELMATGPYPEAVKMRVSGGFGHLANAQAEALLGRLDLSRLRHLVAAHVSERNNRADLAVKALAQGAGWDAAAVTLASQVSGCEWLDFGESWV